MQHVTYRGPLDVVVLAVLDFVVPDLFVVAGVLVILGLVVQVLMLGKDKSGMSIRDSCPKLRCIRSVHRQLS